MILIASLGCIAHWAEPAFAQTNEAIRIVELVGTVEILPHGATTWVLTQTRQPLHTLDRVRTGTNSSLGLLWSDQSVLRFGALTELQILPPHTDDADQGLHLIRGLLSFFHRDQPGRIRVITSGALAGIEGTEFVMQAVTTNGVEQTTLSVIEGKVCFSNEQGALVLTNGEPAVAEPGQAPQRTAGFIANNLLQWCFYYPAVLDLKELSLTKGEEQILGDSLTAYRAGDLLTALAKFSEARQPDSDDGRVYHAALLLAVGQVEQAEALLSALQQTTVADKNQRLAAALRTLIAAVKREPRLSTLNPHLSTELLAASYYEQSVGLRETSLVKALSLAKQSVASSPEFGFGWERVAELEFSFGRTDRAVEALNKSLALAPRNAQALALQGFLLAAQNKTREAIDWFDRALAVDSTLGNAWLGCGLCRIRLGDSQRGREDLLVAAAMEPQRATLRSYLGKAWSDAGDDVRARKELGLAKKLDPKDPTSWLYSALNNEQHNRINEAIGDLEKSQELNENRSVYRSGLLLDQDRAVRSANLARIYQEAGMDDVSIREATRAVNTDYANYSAHLFLANSYNKLRDPNQINLRYETPTFAEYLVGNLLAPVSAGVFSPAVSQQEFSKLFERDRLGVNSTTEYLSRGAWTQSGAQFGTFGNFSYDVEGFYHTDPGQQENNAIEQQQLSVIIKQQLTPQDSVFGMMIYYDEEGGDLFQYYNPTNANLGLRTCERQSPLLAAGFHREWGPGSHTIFLAGRLEDTYSVNNPQSTPLILGESSGVIEGVDPSFTTDQHYWNDQVIYSTEAQQIWQREPHQIIAGVRVQAGDFTTHNQFDVPPDTFYFPSAPPPPENSDSRFERVSVYGYHLWQALDCLQLVGGLSYDWISFPQNFRFAPTGGGQQSEAQVSPKAGFVWTPGGRTTVRGAYTRSLSGASLEQSFQLEPSQVAGFNQLFRSIIPESVAGANAGAHFETVGLSVEQKVGNGTYLGLTAEMLNSKVDRQVGVFISDPFVQDDAYSSTTREHLNFWEHNLLVTADQLLGNNFAVGTRYRLTDASLDDDFPGIPSSGVSLNGFEPSKHQTSLLQQIEMHATFNHPSGFFSRFQSLWTAQNNSGYTPAEPVDDFWQLNVFAGYRSPRRHMELTVGVLNLTGQNYRLNPLTLHGELPRERTLALRLRLDF